MRCAMLHQLWRNGAHRLRHRDLELNKEARLSGPTRSVRGLVREPTGERGRGEASTMAGRMGGRGTQSALLELNMLMSAVSQRRRKRPCLICAFAPLARPARTTAVATSMVQTAMMGGREMVVCLVWPLSATIQTASYRVQIRENERKQICSSQADEYTNKLPTTTPSPTPRCLVPCLGFLNSHGVRYGVRMFLGCSFVAGVYSFSIVFEAR